MNGTTNNDRTLYFETLPANQLELALFLEADRMRSLDITKANLDNQRQAVQEERRLRVDNQPYGQTFEKTGELAYDNFAYKHSIIGSMEDLNAASVDDVATFFKTYYAPNNAVLAIVGDLDTKKTMALVDEVLRPDSPRQPDPKRPDLTEPPHTAERRSTIDDPLARLARVDIAWIIPAAGSPDSDALDVLADILSNGRSSRLNQALVREKQLATTAAAGDPDTRGPGPVPGARHRPPGKTPDALEAAIYDEIDKVKTRPDRRLGNRERRTMPPSGTRRAPPRAACTRAIQLGEVRALLQRSQPDQHAHRTDPEGHRRRRPARRRQISDQGNRSVIIVTPKPAAPAGRSSSEAHALLVAIGFAAWRGAIGLSAPGNSRAAATEPSQAPGPSSKARRQSRRRSSRSRCPSRRKLDLPERRSPDRPRGSSRSARHLSDDHRGRRRLLRPAGRAGARRLHRDADARRHGLARPRNRFPNSSIGWRPRSVPAPASHRRSPS